MRVFIPVGEHYFIIDASAEFPGNKHGAAQLDTLQAQEVSDERIGPANTGVGWRERRYSV